MPKFKEIPISKMEIEPHEYLDCHIVKRRDITRTLKLEDGMEDKPENWMFVGDSEPNRRVIWPTSDTSDEIGFVKEVCASVHTDAKKAIHQAEEDRLAEIARLA